MDQEWSQEIRAGLRGRHARQVHWTLLAAGAAALLILLALARLLPAAYFATLPYALVLEAILVAGQTIGLVGAGREPSTPLHRLLTPFANARGKKPTTIDSHSATTEPGAAISQATERASP